MFIDSGVLSTIKIASLLAQWITESGRGWEKKHLYELEYMQKVGMTVPLGNYQYQVLNYKQNFKYERKILS